MDVYRLCELVDISDKKNSYLIVDNSNFKSYDLKKDNNTEFILSMLLKGPVNRIDFEDKIKKSNIDSRVIKRALSELINLEIVKCSYFPQVKDIEFFSKSELLEKSIDERFGNLIVSYERVETCENNRFEIFNKIQKTSVIIIGAGAVGSHLAMMLAANNIGEITIVDNDFVDISNLTRQLFYTENEIGCKKSVCLKKRINSLNSRVKVNVVDELIESSETAQRILKSSSLIIQTGDKPRGRINDMVNGACIDNNVPVIFCMNGTIGPLYIPGVTACFSCLEKLLRKINRKQFELINKGAMNSSSNWPSSIEGPYYAAYYLFKEVIQFLIGASDNVTKNGFIRLRSFPQSNEVFKFEKIPGCKCDERTD